VTAALLEIRLLVKDYQALRPLRVRELVVPPGRVLSLAGFDAAAAEIFVHLVTGAALPDEGDISLFGTNTRHIKDAEAWLHSLDGLGLVSHRAVLVDMLTVLQNVAMPLTLEVDPIAADLRPQVEALAREAGIAESLWDRPLGHVDAETNLRVRLARAVAPQPTLIIAEHPSAGLPRESVPRLADHVAEMVRARNAALLTLTADPEWVSRIGGDVLTLSPATGELASGGRFMERLKRMFGG
jgi:predicted ABC-type transport system involved in lysophospholipase L1 biosynthesis ATPase subunit